MTEERRPSPPAKQEVAEAPSVTGGDDALISEMMAPPPLEDAQASLDFWRQRRRELPLYRRRARREAELRMASAEETLRASRRAKFGPTLLEQLSEAVGISISPARIRRVVVLTAVTLVLLVVAFVVAAVAFWPEIEPIVRFFIGNGGGEGGD